MTKRILAFTAALGLVLAPVVSLAQSGGKSGEHGDQMKMKGPPNADGYKDQKASGSGKDANGAAAAKATGEDKK